MDFSGQAQQGIAVIRYLLEPMGSDSPPLFRLRRSDVLAYGDELPETASDPILCDKVLAIRLECLDADGETVEEWDSSLEDRGYATPRAVKIRLELFSPVGPSVYQTIVVLPLWRAASGQV